MTLLLIVATILPALAQQDHTVAFSDDSRPRLMKLEVLNGRIVVRGYAGKDAIITNESSPRDAQSAFSVTEQNNVMTLNGGVHKNANLMIQVPFKTSMQIRCTNCSDLRVEGIEGDIDVNTVNGGIRLLNVSGSVLAHSLNQGVTAIIDKVDPNKAMSFSSMNGSLDCTFPANLKANVRMRTANGKIHTDFDVRLNGGEAIRMDRGISGTINGGGPEIVFKAFNGSIHIRKK
jgi:DUF4097 and DUF4098 domain-containing protein YvlB